MKSIGKILVANRGEIAVRILKTLNHLNIRSVIIYTKEEEHSLAAHLAGEAYLMEGNTVNDTYLNIEQIIRIAKQSGADAIHPGYGFLSENPSFARACESAGIVFIGPSSESIKLMGDKISAREFAGNLGIPVLKCLYGNAEELVTKAKQELQFPVLIKPAMGGGGKGMRIVYEGDRLKDEIQASCRETDSYFGSSIIFLEEYIYEAKHIEVQVLGDGKGNAIHLFERECSLQRRFQKIVEEAPSPSLDSNQRKKITDFALKIATEAEYRNAGTVEFIMDSKKNIFFLEMNTRIQVEHPVTESVTGIDIVEEQIWIANHGTLRLAQKDILLKGHAIELRIYAEDPYNDFIPAPGNILFCNEPEMPDLRIDKSFASGNSISTHYDPLLAKLIILGESRSQAIEKLLRAVPSFIILGIPTNLTYLKALLKHPGFALGNYSTQFIQNEWKYFNEQINSIKNNIGIEILATIWVYALTRGTQKMGDVNTTQSPWNDSNHWRSVSFFEFIFEKKHYSFLADLTKSNCTIISKSGENCISVFGGNNTINLSFGDANYTCWFAWNGEGSLFIDVNSWQTRLYPSYFRERNSHRKEVSESEGDESELILAPIHGKIINMKVPVKAEVKKGEVLMIIESMKMENNILATRDGCIQSIFVKNGEQVLKNTPLLSLGVFSRNGRQFHDI